MPKPKLSAHFASRKPSAIRLAQIEFAKRTDGVEAVNTAIGNVSLPMYQPMQDRMAALTAADSPFKDGVVRYSATVGLDETREAFKHVIASSGLAIDDLHVQITDGGSHAMELIILGVCGPAGSDEKPLLVINPAYANYSSMAERTGRKIVSVTRELQADGEFSLPDMAEIEAVIEKEQPSAILVIPYDNPTGQFFTHQQMIDLAKLAVKHNLWIVSDEAYRELFYTDDDTTSSVWALTEKEVPGVAGRRISIETASKVWNACGLRIGALVTDNEEFHQKSVAENTANLCAPVVAQHIFAAVKDVPHKDLQAWYQEQRSYYQPMMKSLHADLTKRLKGVIVSKPEASLYSVVDVRELVDENWQALDFVMYCAQEGKVKIKGKEYTLLVSPMAGFYDLPEGEVNPGRTQMRIAFVEAPEKMALVPELFAQLFEQYQAQK